MDSLGVEDAEDVLSPHRHLDVVDYYTTLSLEDAATEDIMGDLEDQRLSALRSSTCSWEGLLACWHRVRSFAPSLWFFLVCVAVLAAAMGYLLDFLVDRLQVGRLPCLCRVFALRVTLIHLPVTDRAADGRAHTCTGVLHILHHVRRPFLCCCRGVWPPYQRPSHGNSLLTTILRTWVSLSLPI